MYIHMTFYKVHLLVSMGEKSRWIISNSQLFIYKESVCQNQRKAKFFPWTGSSSRALHRALLYRVPHLLGTIYFFTFSTLRSCFELECTVHISSRIYYECLFKLIMIVFYSSLLWSLLIELIMVVFTRVYHDCFLFSLLWLFLLEFIIMVLLEFIMIVLL